MKVLKALKHLINGAIWSLLALFLLIIVLIHVPAIQTWMGRTVADMLASKLGTEVSVGRIDMGLFNRLIIDDVNILDQQGRSLLQAGRMSVKIDLLPLLDGRIHISSAQLFGAQATLSRDSATATPNYQFALDALTSDENSSPSQLDLRIGSLIVRRLSLSYDEHDAPQTPGRLNPHHLHVSDVSAHLLLRALTHDTLNINVKRIQLREQSGLDLQQLTFKGEANKTGALVSAFTLQLPHSTLTLDTLYATYTLDSLLQTLRTECRSVRGLIDPADLHCILPDVVPTSHPLTFETTIETNPNWLHCPLLNISSTDGLLTLSASGALSADGNWRASVEHMTIGEALLEELRDSLPTLPLLVTRMGCISLSGELERNVNAMLTVHSDIGTAIGHLTLEGRQESCQELWTAHMETDSLDLGRLTNNPLLGIIATRLDLSGKSNLIGIEGEVPLLDLNGYRYSHLTLDGTYSTTAIAGKLHIDDPHLQASVEGSYGRGIRLTGTIGNIDPQALHLSDLWGDASFSAIVDADFTATSLADAQGTIDLDDFTMSRGDTLCYHLDNIHLRSGYEEQIHYVRLNSDFGEVQLKGRFDWTTLPQDFAAILPQAEEHPTHSSDNDFVLSVSLSDSHWMEYLLGLNLSLEGPMKLDADVSGATQHLDINATIPSFSYGSNNYRNALIQLQTRGDSTACEARVTRMSDKGHPLYVKLNAQVTNNEIASTLTLANDGSDGGTINAITQIYMNDEGQRETHVRIMPSAIMLHDATWELEPCDILYSNQKLMVDQFTLHHADEHLFIDGVASTLQHDTLTVDLQGLDVQPLLDLANFHAVSFGGKASGKASVIHAFSKPEAWADITVDKFLFQQAHMGTLEAHATWNDEEGQIDLDAAIDDGAEAQTFIDGFISPNRNEIDLGIRARGTSAGFVHSFTSSFISNIDGHVYGDVRLFGPLSHLDLGGEAAVVGQATISSLGTTYDFEGDSVYLSAGTIAFRNFHAYDRDRHKGILNGTLHHTNFKNLTFDFTVDANNLLAYDFPQLDGSGIIGGTVWANGQAVMRGKPGEVVIDCDVTPAEGSFFIYNAASPDAISHQQFITWGKATPDSILPTSVNLPQKAPSSMMASQGDLRMNLRINAVPEATLRLLMDQHSDDVITLNGTGILRASYYNKGPFLMFGTYAVERGTYSMTIQNILKKNFQFQPGSSLVFGGDPLQAALNLKALYTVNGVSLSDLGLGNSFTSNTIRVNCLMNILGTAGEPRVEFDLEMPTVNSEEEQMIRSIIASEQELNQQVVYLLGIGRFYTQTNNNANTQGYGQTELAMQSLLSGTVSSQINQLLSQVIKNDDWNFGANISTGNEGWHNAEYEGVVSGRMLNNRLLLNGQFGYRDNATQATPSFIGDFDIRYLLTPSGNIALKAYNQTNDRYFTHSSLNTQGIGIIMKKDFNGLSDLFTPRRKKVP